MCALRRSWERVLVAYTGSCFHLVIYYKKQAQERIGQFANRNADRDRTLREEVTVDHEISKEGSADLSKGVESMVKRGWVRELKSSRGCMIVGLRVPKGSEVDKQAGGQVGKVKIARK